MAILFAEVAEVPQLARASNRGPHEWEFASEFVIWQIESPCGTRPARLCLRAGRTMSQPSSMQLPARFDESGLWPAASGARTARLARRIETPHVEEVAAGRSV